MIEDINQLPGFCAGHATLADAGTGCTAIVCPAGATGGVDVRGGAPATRETDLLRPEETVDVLHAVVLSGGSAYGLAASCGAAEELERAGIGLDVGVGLVPIVSSACLFDLMVGDSKVRPGIDEGAAAISAALSASGTPLERGNVGAGTGCSVGKLAGPARCMKSGIGQGASGAGELSCVALSAVNAVGNVVDPATGSAIAGMLSEQGDAILPCDEALLSEQATMPLPRTNTTISCICVNARLTKAQATKVAQMAADAYAHAISPTHTTNDGDAIFVMASGDKSWPVDVIGAHATRALERAIVDAARSATGAYGLKSAEDLG